MCDFKLRFKDGIAKKIQFLGIIIYIYGISN